MAKRFRPHRGRLRSILEAVKQKARDRSRAFSLPGRPAQYLYWLPPMNSRRSDFFGTGLSSSTGVRSLRVSYTRLART